MNALGIQESPDHKRGFQVTNCGQVMRHGPIVIVFIVQMIGKSAFNLSNHLRIRLHARQGEMEVENVLKSSGRQVIAHTAYLGAPGELIMTLKHDLSCRAKMRIESKAFFRKQLLILALRLGFWPCLTSGDLQTTLRKISSTLFSS